MATLRRNSSAHMPAIKVLIVEDDVSACRALGSQLVESSGKMTFQFAHSLAEALMQLSRRKCDVILLNLMLADSRGLDTFVEIQAKVPNTPILILSGVSEAQAMKAVQQGAQDFIDKRGGDIKLLERMIRYAIERSAAERSRLEGERRLLEMQTMRSQGLMATGVAHDFNNLLATIIGRLQLIQLKRQDAVLSAQLEDVISTSYRAADLARQMMACAGKGQAGTVVIDLNKLINEMSGLIRSAITRKIEVHKEFSTEVPCIKCDPTQVRQVLMNLIFNSAQAFGESGGSITIRTGHVQADDQCLKEFHMCDAMPGNYVFMDVVDSACGMDAATLSRLFEPFFTTKSSGHGLGMAAILGIVRQHKGAIRVRSALGAGTTITVMFPVHVLQPSFGSGMYKHDSKMTDKSKSGRFLNIPAEPAQGLPKKPSQIIES